MNIALWIVQVIVAILFLMAGVMHGLRHEQAMAQAKWIADVAPALLIFIGVVEILGALGVILPALTGIQRWLTPLAASGLALMMVFAMGFHAVRGEYPNIAFTFILFALAAFVAYGRWVLRPL